MKPRPIRVIASSTDGTSPFVSASRSHSGIPVLHRQPDRLDAAAVLRHRPPAEPQGLDHVLEDDRHRREELELGDDLAVDEPRPIGDRDWGRAISRASMCLSIERHADWPVVAGADQGYSII